MERGYMNDIERKQQFYTMLGKSNPKISLTKEEIKIANEVASARHYYSRKLGLHDASTEIGGLTLKEPDIVGAYGELAVHKWLELHWKVDPRVPGYGGDVGGWIEVKSSNYPNARLLARPSASGKHTLMMERPFLLVTVDKPIVTIAGWEWGYKLMSDANWGNPFPNSRGDCWTLTQNKLQHPEVLKKLIEERLKSTVTIL